MPACLQASKLRNLAYAYPNSSCAASRVWLHSGESPWSKPSARPWKPGPHSPRRRAASPLAAPPVRSPGLPRRSLGGRPAPRNRTPARRRDADAEPAPSPTAVSRQVSTALRWNGSGKSGPWTGQNVPRWKAYRQKSAAFGLFVELACPWLLSSGAWPRAKSWAKLPGYWGSLTNR